MTEQELLVDCLRRLNGAGIAYMLTGSMASNAWGIPRSTHDLDFVIQLPPSEIPKFVAAFQNAYYIDEGSVRADASGLDRVPDQRDRGLLPMNQVHPRHTSPWRRGRACSC